LDSGALWRERLRVMLHSARRQAGLSQFELACAIGTTDKTVYRIEKGLTKAADDLVDEWLRVTGFEIDTTLRRRDGNP